MKCSVSCIFFSLVALAGWVVHQFILETADHLALPPVFWSTVLFSLFIALFLQGILCWHRA